MAFPTTPVLDTFTGTNGTTPPNANWTNTAVFGPGVQIQSNTAAPTTLTAPPFDQDAYWSVSDFGPDAEVYCTASVLGTNSSEGFKLFTRLITPGTGACGYMLTVAHDGTAFQRWTIYRVTSGSPTQLGAFATQAVTAGDLVGLEASGSTLNAWYKPAAGSWTLVVSRIDATYSVAGKIGLGFSLAVPAAVHRADGFGGGTTIVPGSQPSFPLAARVRYNV